MASPSYSGPARAPWRDLLESHLSQSSTREFSIATVDHSETHHPRPRVRICGFRGFFPELDLHPNGAEDMKQQVEDGGNPPVFESNMLAFTTDVRMEKLGQLDSAWDEIEAVFWFKEVMTQWRVKGHAFAIGDPSGPDEAHEKGAQSAINKGLRVKGGSDGEEVGKWTWEKAVTKYFANHSPVMRGVCFFFFCWAVYHSPFAPVLSFYCTPCMQRYNAIPSCFKLNANFIQRFIQQSSTWSTQIPGTK